MSDRYSGVLYFDSSIQGHLWLETELHLILSALENMAAALFI